MSRSTSSDPREGIWRSAARQGGGIILVSLVASGLYWGFGTVVPPLIPPDRSSASGDTLAVAITDSTPSAMPTPGQEIGSGLDLTVDTTLASQSPTPVDTVASGPSEAELARAREDSIRRARVAMQQAARDSAAAAQRQAAAADAANLLTQVAKAKEISTPLAKRLYDLSRSESDRVTFIDARTEEEYAQGHIPGAMNAYGGAWQSHIPQLVQLPRDRQIVVYCGGGDCELSHDLADGLRQIGFTKVAVYLGGTAEWTAKNYPLTK